jgi:hypothetical protein
MIRCELIIEKDGKVVYKDISKSFVQNFAKLFGAMFSATATGTAVSTTVTGKDSAPKTVYTEWYCGNTKNGGGTPMAANAPDNDDSFGIVVGSGTTPVSTSDYNLASQISHGTSSGQLDYDAHSFVSSYASVSSYVEISRVFVNKSGADVVVREVGLVCRNYWKDYLALRVDQKILMARDVLPTPITVKNLGSLTVRYRVSLTLT